MSENQVQSSATEENVISDYYEGVRQLEMEGHESGIRKARNMLFVIAGITLAFELITVAAAGVPFTPAIIAIIAIETGIFVGLALWTKSKPYTALIVAIIIYSAFGLLSIIAGGLSILGIAVKIGIIAYLVKGLKPAKAWEDLKKSS